MSEFLAIEELLEEEKREETIPLPSGSEVRIRSLVLEEARVVEKASLKGMAGSTDLEGLMTGLEMVTRGNGGDGGNGGEEQGRGEIPFGDIIMGLDIEALMDADYEANVLATHHGLIEPEASEEQVRRMAPVIVETIGQAVRTLSGLTSTSIPEALQEAVVAQR